MNDYNIEFIPENHIYLINGIITESVTQLIHKKMPNLYANVPRSVLDAASTLGSNVHKAIEHDCKDLEPPKLTIQQGVCFNQYLKLKHEYNIVPLESELLVHYKDKYVGTLDLVAEVNGELSLIDIKTTRELNKEYLEIQLALYHKALKSMGYEKEIKKYYSIHLAKGKLGRLVEIRQMSDEEVDSFLKEVGVE